MFKIDESIRFWGLVKKILQSLRYDKSKDIDGVDALILKPTVLGGSEKSWQMAQFAHQIGLKGVISSSFESGLGIMAISHLASNLTHYVSYGLDTTKYFDRDIIKNPIKIEHGQLDIDQFSFRKDEIDFNILKRVI